MHIRIYKIRDYDDKFKILILPLTNNISRTVRLVYMSDIVVKIEPNYDAMYVMKHRYEPHSMTVVKYNEKYIYDIIFDNVDPDCIYISTETDLDSSLKYKNTKLAFSSTKMYKFPLQQIKKDDMIHLFDYLGTIFCE